MTTSEAGRLGAQKLNESRTPEQRKASARLAIKSRWNRVMKLINPSTGLMECTVCGATHFASIKPRSGGRYYRGSWQCVNKCKKEDQK